MINNAAEHHFMHILEKNWAALNITLDVKWCCTNSQNYFLVLPASSWCILRVRDKITLSTKGCAISCLTFIVLLYLIAKHPISHLQKRLYSLRKRMILQKSYSLEVMHIFLNFLLSRKPKEWKKKKKELWKFSIYRGIKSEGTSIIKVIRLLIFDILKNSVAVVLDSI